MTPSSFRALLPRLMGWPRPTRLLDHVFVRFCMVGSLGFAVNYATLLLLHGKLGATIIVAQLIGAELAIISNFCLHTIWTYRGDYHPAPLLARLLRFHATAVTGGLINSAVVVASVTWLHISPLVGLVAGSLIALVWNFLWTRYYVWAKQAPAKPAPARTDT